MRNFPEWIMKDIKQYIMPAYVDLVGEIIDWHFEDYLVRIGKLEPSGREHPGQRLQTCSECGKEVKLLQLYYGEILCEECALKAYRKRLGVE